MLWLAFTFMNKLAIRETANLFSLDVFGCVIAGNTQLELMKLTSLAPIKYPNKYAWHCIYVLPWCYHLLFSAIIVFIAPLTKYLNSSTMFSSIVSTNYIVFLSLEIKFSNYSDVLLFGRFAGFLLGFQSLCNITVNNLVEAYNDKIEWLVKKNN